MSEREFEQFISLVTKNLQLPPAQREEIEDEMRDHLEQRLEELLSGDGSRDEAIRAAIEEFGDAAELAHHFTHISHVQHRRQIMRRALASMALLALLLLVAFAFWPHDAVQPIPQWIVPQAVAQEGAMGGAEMTPEQKDKADVDAKLARRVAIDFVETPLEDALHFLQEAVSLAIVMDDELLASKTAENSPLNKLVTLQIAAEHASVRTILDLMLEPNKLGYTIRDRLILITSADRANEIVIYNVRDLLPEYSMPGMPGGVPGAAMGSFDPNGVAMPGVEGGGAFGGGMPGAPGGTMGSAFGSDPLGKQNKLCFKLSETASLPVVVAAMIEPMSWEINGGHGNITQYNGLMVVKNSQAVHAKVRRLLEMMRSAVNGTGG